MHSPVTDRALTDGVADLNVMALGAARKAIEGSLDAPVHAATRSLSEDAA
jgi:hypothetical protein